MSTATAKRSTFTATKKAYRSRPGFLITCRIPKYLVARIEERSLRVGQVVRSPEVDEKTGASIWNDMKGFSVLFERRATVPFQFAVEASVWSAVVAFAEDLGISPIEWVVACIWRANLMMNKVEYSVHHEGAWRGWWLG